MLTSNDNTQKTNLPPSLGEGLGVGVPSLGEGLGVGVPSLGEGLGVGSRLGVATPPPRGGERGEVLPVVDDQGHVLGSVSRQHAHDGSCVLHPVVHLHVFNSRRQLYLQHRPAWKDIQPDRWDTATGGHVDYGETIDDALRREVSEELGITDYRPTPLCRYVFRSDREHELVHVFATVYDGTLHPSPTELDGGRFWDLSELEAAIGHGLLTPNLEREYTEHLKPRLAQILK